MDERFACMERLRLLTEYHRAIIRCYGRPNGVRLKAKDRDAALLALITSLSAYQDHVKTHQCAESESETVQSPGLALVI